jgi:hypothetical protein
MAILLGVLPWVFMFVFTQTTVNAVRHLPIHGVGGGRVLATW